MAMAAQEPRVPGASRWWAPFRSGKTTLLEAILARTGAIQRQGTVEAGTTRRRRLQGSPPSQDERRAHRRHHRHSWTTATRSSIARAPSNSLHDMRAALPAVDAAVVVCEADEKKMPQLQLIMRELEDLNIPRFLFLNKIDKAETKVMEALAILQPASRKPLVMRQLPIRQNDIVTGFVDLALERVHVYKEHAPSEVIPLEGENLDRAKDARFSMLEKLADHDDELMEQLLADIPPPRDKVFDDLAKELRDGLVVPVLMGVATRTNGVLRLLKALRHEAPNVRSDRQAPRRHRQRAARLCAEDAQHRPRRQDVDRPRAVRPDRRRRHAAVAGARGRPGVRHLQAARPDHREARAGERRRDGGARQARIRQDRRHAVGRQAGACGASPRSSRIRRCWRSRSRRRSARTTSSSARLCTSSSTRTRRSISSTIAETHEVVMWGQGEMHLRVASEKLAGHFGVAISTGRPSVGYNETIKKPIQQRGRHKKQSGGQPRRSAKRRVLARGESAPDQNSSRLSRRCLLPYAVRTSPRRCNAGTSPSVISAIVRRFTFGIENRKPSPPTSSITSPICAAT